MKMLNFFYATIAVLWIGASPASAELLLTVDARDPSQVQLTATSGLSAVSSIGTGYGILLKGALSTTSSEGRFLGSQPQPLRPAQGGGFILVGARGTALDLTGGGRNNQVFTAGQLAFTGSTAINLSIFQFATNDFIGDIEVRDNFGRLTGAIIGQFQFLAKPAPVPLPAAAWLFVCGLGALGVFGRRKGAVQPDRVSGFGAPA